MAFLLNVVFLILIANGKYFWAALCVLAELAARADAAKKRKARLSNDQEKGVGQTHGHVRPDAARSDESR
jgi:hypothetical protein